MENSALIPASILVYLFADQFSEPAKGLTIQGAIAPRTGTKLNAKPLVLNLYLAAIMELMEAGIVRLEAVELKKFLGKETALTLTFLREPGERISGLAWQIVQSLQAAKTPEQRRVREVVIRVIGGRSSTYYPWLVALSWSIGEAEAKGFIQRPQEKPNVLKAMFNPTESLTRATAIGDCVTQVESDLALVKSRLAAYELSLGTNAPLLRKEIEKGIDECTQRSND